MDPRCACVLVAARAATSRPLGRVTLSAGLALCILAWAISCLAATLVVERNVNLRRDPSTGQPEIRLLEPPEELDLLEPARTNSYYHVRTDDGEEGWVYSARVRLLTDDAGNVVSPSAATDVATAISETWDKPTPNNSQFTAADGTPCGSTGSGTDPENNRRKNRTDLPTSYHSVTFDAITGLPEDGYPVLRANWSTQQKTEAARFEGTAVTVEGYLVAIKVQAGEGTNCGLTGAANVDWHMALVKEFGDGEKESIVIETTPRIRRNHAKWTKTRLNPWVDSHDPVRISGWLFLDPFHTNHLGRYRKTLWEVHPITTIEVYQQGEWKSLDALP